MGEQQMKVWVRRGGTFLIGISLLLFGMILIPLLYENARYFLIKKQELPERIRLFQTEEKVDREGTDITIPEKGMTLVVPKIKAIAPIIEDVDPLDERVYREALKDGVAHASGTALPGEMGNAFLFAHSSDNFYALSPYNTVFFLLDKLESGDTFYVSREGRLYEYVVNDVRVVESDAVEYLHAQGEIPTVTLMTCWPPMTDAKRRIVIGYLRSTSDSGKIHIASDIQEE